MTQEVQAGLEAQPDIPDTDVAAVKPEVAEQELAETPEEKIARLEKAEYGLKKRIDKLTAKHRTSEETAAQYRARLEQIHNAQNPGQQQSPPSSEEIYSIARKQAEAAQAIIQLDKRSPKFKENLLEIEAAGVALVGQNSLPLPMLEAILDMEKPDKIVAYLAKNPEEAEELEGLSPTRLARKLMSIENNLAASKETKVSSAAKPLEPVKNGAASSALPPETDRYAWIEARNKQVGRR